MKVNKKLIISKMQEKGLTSKDIGDMLKITSAGFLMKVNEKRKFSLVEGLIIADTLDIDPHDIILDWKE